MLNIFNGWAIGHRYSLVLLGAGKTVSKTFYTREAANHAMYKLMGKHNLSLEKVYNDIHDKTYICSNGAEFHINRL